MSTLFGCRAVIEAMGLSDVAPCESCHSDMDARDVGIIDCDHGHGLAGTLSDGRDYEDVCCGVVLALEGVTDAT